MSELFKLKIITSGRDVKAIRLFCDDIESHVRSLDGLETNSQEYASLSALIIMERIRLPHQLKLIIGKKIKDDLISNERLIIVIK